MDFSRVILGLVNLAFGVDLDVLLNSWLILKEFLRNFPRWTINREYPDRISVSVDVNVIVVAIFKNLCFVDNANKCALWITAWFKYFLTVRKSFHLKTKTNFDYIALTKPAPSATIHTPFIRFIRLFFFFISNNENT